eukprot:ANDGO_00461.mRNA.1 hypothetical protein
MAYWSDSRSDTSTTNGSVRSRHPHMSNQSLSLNHAFPTHIQRNSVSTLVQQYALRDMLLETHDVSCESFEKQMVEQRVKVDAMIRDMSAVDNRLARASSGAETMRSNVRDLSATLANHRDEWSELCRAEDRIRQRFFLNLNRTIASVSMTIPSQPTIPASQDRPKSPANGSP